MRKEEAYVQNKLVSRTLKGASRAFPMWSEQRP